MCICVWMCLCAALVLEIRMIRANSPHSCPAALPLLPLVCCLLLLLLLFYSHSHIVYVSMCVWMCASCIVSVFCHGHGLSRRVCVCACICLSFCLCSRLFMCVCVLVRWGRRRSYVFACCSVGFDSVLDGWYGLALDRRLPLPAWLLFSSPLSTHASVVVAAFHPYISRSPFARLALANGDDDRSYMSVCLCVCLSLRSCCLRWIVCASILCDVFFLCSFAAVNVTLSPSLICTSRKARCSFITLIFRRSSTNTNTQTNVQNRRSLSLFEMQSSCAVVVVSGGGRHVVWGRVWRLFDFFCTYFCQAAQAKSWLKLFRHSMGVCVRSFFAQFILSVCVPVWLCVRVRSFIFICCLSDGRVLVYVSVYVCVCICFWLKIHNYF